MFKIFKYLTKKDWLLIGFSVLLIVLQVWLEVTMPTYTNNLTKAISSGAASKTEVWKNGGFMLACAGASMVAAIICGYFISQVAANFAKTLRLKLFDKINNFSSADINRFSVPSLITRTTNDVVQMQMLIAMGLRVAIKAPVMAVWTICKISTTHIAWTAAVIITVFVIVLMLSLIVGLCYPRFKRIQKLTDDLNEVTRENISGVRVIRAYNADEFQAKKFEKVNDAVTKNHLFTARIMGFMTPVMTLCMSGLSLAIYWIAAILMNNVTGMAEEVAAQRITIIGNMAAFSQYALQVVGAFMMLIMIFIILPRTLVSGKRINEVLETSPSIIYPLTSPEVKAKGEIEFKDVSFKYSDGKEACIKNINFKINKGETFAIIGATGSGKSTLINLIPRFFDTTEGEVLLGGNDIKSYSRDDLNKMIAIAPQKAALFKGDIKSNITYGQKEEIADDDPRLMKAINVSQSDFVFEKQKGIHSEVAQGGINFSGGQKQRLSIARAIFKDSDIVIFDDTFSALDYKTDMLVRKEIKENLQGTTVIIVAQRIGTIKNADQILVLDKGEIAGLGKHEELMKNCEVYKNIALSQLSKEEL